MINWRYWRNWGVARVIRLRFDDAMRETSAEDFVRKILPALGVRALYGGGGFYFWCRAWG